MTSGWIIFLEILLVLGLAIGWGVHEIRGLNRLKREREAREKAEAASRPAGDGA
ncbi:hypothetical protein RUR49_22540 [Pseudoxanthobacter sp. M-2]|uniref:hypothetical protein n=1 Tax=Pseudoxanthobacter sp. M-2 TaxID=3078754 RepID=UPI0038FBEDAD